MAIVIRFGSSADLVDDNRSSQLISQLHDLFSRFDPSIQILRVVVTAPCLKPKRSSIFRNCRSPVSDN